MRIAILLLVTASATAAAEPNVCTRLVVPPDPEGHFEGEGSTLEEMTARAWGTQKPKDTCDVRRRDAVESAIAAAPHGGKRRKADPAWDHRSAPGFHDLVTAALAVTPDEDRRLFRDGLVVPERLAYDDYTSAYYDIHRGQLPIFVTADSILHAVYASHDQLLATLERDVLVRKLDDALGRMHCALAAAAKDYPDDVARDLDLYLTVARRLLADDGTDIAPQVDPALADRAGVLVELVRTASGLTEIDLFGRKRAFDASMYLPRGHYESDGLQPFFRAAMWMSRLELNLVSRDTRSSQPGYQPDPTETPREAVDALALADLAQRSSALDDLDAIDQAWTAMAGTREDVSLRDLLALRKQAGITKLAVPASADRLRAAIGDRFQRTVNIFPNPDVRRLPVVATVLGPRVTVDTRALAAVPNRGVPEPQIAAAGLAFALGHDRALAYLPADADRTALAAAATAMRGAPSARRSDVYSAWLDAILGLAHTPAGALPSVMRTPAFADLRMDTALTAYGQLRHNHVLVAAQLYNVGGCEIPDGYVEPAPDTYAALVTWAARGEAMFAKLDPKGKTGGAAYFRRTGHVIGILAAIARDELAGRPLSEAERRFLAMVVEERDTEAWNYNGPFPLPTYDGWFLDLFPSQEAAFHDAAFIADYATHDINGSRWVDYIGAQGPRLGLFVVDVGGSPRVMVGPVARGFATSSGLDARYTDTTMGRAAATMPWAASYTAAGAPEPSLLVEFARTPVPLGGKGWRGGRGPLEPGTLRASGPPSAGDITVELRDHHFAKISEVTLHPAKGKAEVHVPLDQADRTEQLVVRTGDFIGRIDVPARGVATRQFGAP